MIGTILNAVAIALGATLGLLWRRPPSPATQRRLQTLLGALTLLAGFSLLWSALNGSFAQVARQLGVLLLALSFGRLTGHLLRLQHHMNRLGRYTRERLARTQAGTPVTFGEGFLACTVVFCAAPMALLGALEEGFGRGFRILAIKALLDGLAALGFVRTFGPSVLLSALPVLAYQGTLTLLARGAAPGLAHHALLDPILAVTGFILLAVALVVFGVKQVRLADYLPSLGYAALFAAWLL